MSRAANLLNNSPTGTLGIIGLCSFLYLLQLVFGFNLVHFTMCPRLVLYKHEYYRIVTSVLLHGSFMHIGMNMMSTAAISSLLEKRMGTIRLLLTVVVSILLTAVLHISFALIVSFFGHDGLINGHSIGFSGVIFHLSVLESSLDQQRTRSLFGIVTVPSYLYPWVLLVVLQVMVPNLSFIGHLSGILAGTLQLYGMLNRVMVTDREVFLQMEEWRIIKWMTCHPGFVSAPTESLDTRHDITALPRAFHHAVLTVFRFGGNVLETIQVVVLGRGRSQNENIQLDLNLSLEDEDDGDEWNGLPNVDERELAQQLV